MPTYIETYVIPGSGRYGIEDHDDGQIGHFFPDRYKEGKSKRFQLWSGGSGIGDVNTLEEAWGSIHHHIMQDLKRKQKTLESDLARVNKSIKSLGTNNRNLVRFEVQN